MTAPRSPARSASRSIWTWSRRSPRRTRTERDQSCRESVGGRYGFSSKEFTPAMVAGVAEIARERPRRRFTIGIDDDVSWTSVDYDPSFDIESPDTFRACSSGWVRTALSARTRIPSRSLGPRRACTRRRTSSTTRRSRVRRPSRIYASGRPHRAPYLVTGPISLAATIPVPRHRRLLGRAGPGATLLLNCRLPAGRVWAALHGGRRTVWP